MATERAQHTVARQTTQAMTMLGRTVREMLARGEDPTELLADVERAIRKAQIRRAA